VVRGLLRDAAGVIAAVVTLWVVALLVGLAVSAAWPPAGTHTAGLAVDSRNLPGTLLGFVLALYVFRAVSRSRGSEGTTSAGNWERRGAEAGGKTLSTPVPQPTTPSPARPVPPPAPPKPARSEALTLLETLQREARLIDFLKEDIAAYQDAQIGAAVRDIHRDAAKALERLFALRPVLDQAEGSPVTLGGDQAGRVRLVGNVREGATAGTLVHHGWAATKAELPLWSGPKDAERVVAPAEVEVA
jgi:hypothetical protein